MNITLKQLLQLIKQYNKVNGTQVSLVLYDNGQCQLVFGNVFSTRLTIETMVKYITS